jgi:hypothetical protein
MNGISHSEIGLKRNNSSLASGIYLIFLEWIFVPAVQLLWIPWFWKSTHSVASALILLKLQCRRAKSCVYQIRMSRSWFYFSLNMHKCVAKFTIMTLNQEGTSGLPHFLVLLGTFRYFFILFGTFRYFFVLLWTFRTSSHSHTLLFFFCAGLI